MLMSASGVVRGSDPHVFNMVVVDLPARDSRDPRVAGWIGFFDPDDLLPDGPGINDNLAGGGDMPTDEDVQREERLPEPIPVRTEPVPVPDPVPPPTGPTPVPRMPQRRGRPVPSEAPPDEVCEDGEGPAEPDDMIFTFADPKFIGKSYLLEDTTMYIKHEE